MLQSNSSVYGLQNTTTSMASSELLEKRQQRAEKQLQEKFDLVKRVNQIDSAMGFDSLNFKDFARIGWLVNMRETLVDDPNGWKTGRSALDFYFIEDDGSSFKATIVHSPYFLICCKDKKENDVQVFLKRQFADTIETVETIKKENLDLPNHLIGNQSTYLKLSFRNTQDMLDVKRTLMPVVRKNAQSKSATDVYSISAAGVDMDFEDSVMDKNISLNGQDFISDIREHDIPYLARIAIDFDYRVGVWYSVKDSQGEITLEREKKKVLPAEPVVLAFDIETSKAPLKFPDSNHDQIMMISYMVDKQGFLITNREIVSSDIEDFDYSPKPGEYDGPFIIFNEENERALLKRFYEHIRELKPAVFVTYNGDFFDWPFVENRSIINGLNMFDEIGFSKNDQGEYCSSYACHMDCLKWVKRDSYLPVGSQGLKSVTKSKLGYNPKELDPELMTPYASDFPQVLADYSVSDAVATYYLYMKYVHPFIFSLCYIVPLGPDDVLRKGSGTLCEMLLMVEAFKANVIMPNKHQEQRGRMFEGHLLESETYVGGHVEALESGVFRSDLPTTFRIDPGTIERLMKDVDRALKFTIQVESKVSLDSVLNFDEVKSQILEILMDLRDNPIRKEAPLIYHLDVAAMYPNIILTNRLQPPALISEEVCATCDFNKPGANCQRKMEWSWRGEFFPADRSELNMIKNQLSAEKFPAKFQGGQLRSWGELSAAEQSSQLQKRLSTYCRKVYHKIRENRVETKESIVCMRENSFYIDTVRNFRDRRYEYKGKLKQWKKSLEKSIKEADPALMYESQKMIVLMDSLQLAHKCILNSFYGYVMRKGSRWYSMEMAGIVCQTGANIIRMAREIVERIGRPLELDTDGIWCILPASFPENFQFNLKSGKTITISYPCVMLNHLVHDLFTNHQYQTLEDPDNFTYRTHSENSIFFEVDGPYRAMILPASKEENKLLKKRYAVFNDDGSLAELKGFEVKRRGELKIIKIFQEEVFKVFLQGDSLQKCYDAVAEVANRWLDILYSRGKTTPDEELLEYISENRSMSKTLEEYGDQKSTSISTAKRLSEFLGDQMVKDKGLACKFIISAKPFGTPVTQRAVPIAIFSAEDGVKRHFLKKWLCDNSLTSFDLRDILDWQYYIERFGSTIQKLVTIPAAMQNVPNPVPRIKHPDWLIKRGGKRHDSRQNKITDNFKKISKEEYQQNVNKNFERDAKMVDIEETIGISAKSLKKVDNSNTDAELVLPDLMPDKYIDYSKWLEYQKIKWKIQRRDKKLLKEGLESGALKTKLNQNNLSTFLRQRNRILMRQKWEVIQIAETEIPGEFRLWALVDSGLYSIRLTVPRIFFVNCLQADTTGRFKRTSKIPPRSQQMQYLYEFNFHESDYLEHSDVYKNFAWHHDVDGVYETKIPLLFRALLHLGCQVSVDSTNSFAFKKSLEDRFELDEIIPSKYPISEYLTRSSLKYVYLYQSICDSRSLYGFFIPHLSQLQLVIVDPFNNKSTPNISRMYSDIKRMVEEHDDIPENAQGLFDYSDTISYEISYSKTDSGALKILQKILVSYQNGKFGPTAILSQTSSSIMVMSSRIRVLSQFPIISIPYGMKDDSYPPLDWQKFACKKMLQGFLYSKSWLADRIILSRHSNVPVGNIEADPTIFLSDLNYARNLEKKDMLLWYSDFDKPDLGGKEEDDNLFSLKEMVDPELSYPGFYSTVCLEYELENLPLNAILQSIYINEMEGADPYAGLSKADMTSMDEHIAKSDIKDLSVVSKSFVSQTSNFDSNMPSFHAFKCLKDMIKGWAKDYMVHLNPVGELMVRHFYRWISDPSSRMYDPGLYEHLHNLMKKTLMQLLAEFSRLGSKIVYADFNKIIVLTTKTSYANAKAYSDFLVKTLKEKSAFGFLDLRDKSWWDCLLWMDKRNYAGISCNREHFDADSYETNETQQIEDYGPNLFMDWNICETRLPPFCRPHFKVLVGELIDSLFRIRLETRGTRGKSKSSKHQNEDELFMKQNQLIREKFTPKFLDIVSDVKSTTSSFVGSEEERRMLEFPKRFQDSLCENSGDLDPALELIKTVSHVFGLHKDIQDEVRLMKRALLTMVGIREFSPKAEFAIDHNEGVVVRHIVCLYCQYCRDIDLTNELDVIFAAPGKVKGSGKETFWKCPQCAHPYSKSIIETKLLRVLEKIIVSYQLQDLECTKCGSIKCDYAGSVCDQCGGCEFKIMRNGLGIGFGINNSMLGNISLKQAKEVDNLSDDKDIQQRTMMRIRSLGYIAEYHKLESLREFTEWIFSS